MEIKNRKPLKTVIFRRMPRDIKRIGRGSCNKTLFMAWKSKHDISMADPPTVVKEKVVKAVVDNRLEEGVYTPKLIISGNVGERLPPVIVTETDIAMELARRNGF